MSAKVKQRTLRGAHARIAAEEERTGSKTAMLVLIIVFVALVAILLRLAEFSGHGNRRPVPSPPPAVAIFSMQ